jgi:hypothetical protein
MDSEKAPLVASVTDDSSASADAHEPFLTTRRVATIVAGVIALTAATVGVNAALGKAYRAADGRAQGAAFSTSTSSTSSHTLAVSDEYSRSLGRTIGDGLYGTDVLVQVHKPTTFQLLNRNGNEVRGAKWSIDGTAAEKSTLEEAAKAAASEQASTSAELLFTAPGVYKVTAAIPGGGKATFDVTAKVVRREIRDLTEDDREAYFSAVHTMYNIGQVAGEATYGSDFMSSDYLLREHLYGAAQKECDHWHDDAGFLNHHIGITWQFEKSLRMINPTTASHYWDYTREASEGVNWWESNIFGDDWFGPCNPKDPHHVVNVGRFAYTPVMREARSFSNITNPYGLLRSPWNTNPTPYLMRYSRTMGKFGDGNTAFPTCAIFATTLSSDITLSTLLQVGNGRLHGPVHIMIGGFWNTAQKVMVQYGSKQVGDNFLLMAKWLWRTGLVRTPSYCSSDTASEDCMPTCPESLTEGHTAEELFKLHGLYNISSFSPLVDGFTADELLTELCHVGYAGEMFTSSAPQDPLFWSVHGDIERYVQLIRVLQYKGYVVLDETWSYKHAKGLASDVGAVCHWDGVDGVKMPTCATGTCPGHKEDDLLPFANLSPDLPRYVTNRQLWDSSHPISGQLDYVYDALDYWKGCKSHSMTMEGLGIDFQES